MAYHLFRRDGPAGMAAIRFTPGHSGEPFPSSLPGRRAYSRWRAKRAASANT